MKILQLKSALFSLMAFALMAIFLLNPSSVFATHYYVSNSGKDSNNGTSQNTSFKTLAKVNSLNLKPGDIVSLKGGQTFTSATNSVGLKIKNSGTANARIVVNSYGGGRAIIQSSSTLALLVEDASYVTIINLILRGEYVGKQTGEDVSSNTNAGLVVRSSTKNCNNIVIEKVQASKFKWEGIRFDSHKQGFAVQNSTIRDCVTFKNGNRGIGTTGRNGGTNKNIMITNCRSYDNHGWNAIPAGSGIHVSGADNITIQHCVAYNNGAYNSSDAGGCGIWASGSSDVLIQFNESYNNKTRKADGCGFDIDGGVQGAVVQYNYSHGNDGAGFLVYQHRKGRTLKNVTVRYNISENDSKKAKHAAINVESIGSAQNDIENIFIYNNTVYNNKANVASVRARKLNTRENLKNIRIYNNLLIRPNGGTTYQTNDNNNIKRQNNHTATNGNSVVQNAGQGGTLLPNRKLTDLNAYKIKNNPAIVNKGINLNNNGVPNLTNKDFYGNSIPQNGAFDIGANEFVNTSQPCSEILTNNTFTGQNTNNIPAWKTHKGNGANMSSSINQWNVAHLKISNGGPQKYSLQLFQDNLAIENNSNYVIKVRMRAAKNRSIRVIVRPAEFPNGEAYYYLNRTSVNLTSDFKEYTFNFNSNRAESNARLAFLVGSNNEDVFIDRVSFKKVCNNKITESKQLAKIYPNPVSNHLTVSLDENVQNADITLFDLTGRLILTQNTGSDTETSIDVSKLVAGSYFVRIQLGNAVYTQKILKH